MQRSIRKNEQDVHVILAIPRFFASYRKELFIHVNANHMQQQEREFIVGTR